MKKTLLSLVLGTCTSALIAQVSFDTQTSGTIQNLKGSTIKPGSTTVWAVGAGGTILNTTDAGNTWTSQSSGVTATLEDVMWGASGNGGLEFVWACGSSATALSTMDAGATWAVQSQGAPYDAFTINFQGISNGIMMGDQFYARSSNGGNMYTPTVTNLTYLAVDFVGSTGWVTGNTGFIKKTTDGGATWTDQTSGTNQALHGIDFINANEGWACGLAGTILHTTDGGTTWTAQTSNTANLLSDIKFADNQKGWACGYTGTILKTTNGGVTWTPYFSGATGTTAWLQSISLFNSDEGVAVGDVGTIIKFIDNGSSANIDETELNKLAIYPNPASDLITLKTQGTIEKVQIFNVMGDLVQTEQSNSFSIRELNTGIYIVDVRTSVGSYRTRISKK